VTIIPPKDGKKYNLCNIFEIEAPQSFLSLFASSEAETVKAGAAKKK
jgi:hypothetical protein